MPDPFDASCSPLARRHRPFRRALVGLAALALSGHPGEARAASIVLLEQDRGVFSRAAASATGASDEAVDAAEAGDFAFFHAAGQSDAAVAASNASGTASLISGLETEAVGARGSASSTAATSGADGDAAAPGDAFFELLFRVDTPETFALGGAVSASGGPGDGYASVALVEAGTGASVISHEAGPGQSASFRESGTLLAGVEYRLTAFALSNADVDGAPPAASGQASAEVVIGVPEPGRHVLLGAGLAGLAALHALRRRGGRARTGVPT